MLKNRVANASAMLILLSLACSAHAEECPNTSSEIDTDRPDVTNSSTVIPMGSLQVENGVNFTKWRDGDQFDGTNTRLRLGVIKCGEVLVDLPNYTDSLHGGVKGFSDIAPAVKVQLQDLPKGLQVSIAAGVGLPTGNSAISGKGYNPYIQIPWSQELINGWSVHGMVTQTWLPKQTNNSSFETTFSINRDLGEHADAFIEYVGDYPNHDIASQVIDFGGVYRLTHRQQIDFRAGFGFTEQSPKFFVGVGYSFRIDSLF